VSWTLRRLAISAFVTLHVAALVIWNLPACAIRQRCEVAAGYYLLPTGLWQYWGMFAPDPVRDTLRLEALVLDRRGILRSFAFPRVSDHSPWQGWWVFRHSKYAANMASPESVAQREFAARYVIRRMGLSPADFPVEVQLVYQVEAAPPVGSPRSDPPPEAKAFAIRTYRFPTLQEALP
jgi:hypothetical protein